MKGPSFNGGRGTKGQPLLLRCLYCGEDWADTDEFFRYWKGKRLGRKCLGCYADERSKRGSKPHLCPTCLAVRTPETECHGCAGRIIGPLTVEILRRLGLAGRNLDRAA
jgi:hypothetical protein